MHDKDQELELFFAAARDDAPVPSDDLMARVFADSVENMPSGAGIVPAPLVKDGVVTRFLKAIGGWPALAGLATATMAGVWIGYSAPAGLATVTGGVLASSDTGYDIVDLIPSMDGFLMEGGA
ncbi:dihydroorotate dehydrogenase [Actibacterium lipolyticum]|nr:dihydroorotate dehydrogenase [Actibacterium lipolyticum]